MYIYTSALCKYNSGYLSVALYMTFRSSNCNHHDHHSSMLHSRDQTLEQYLFNASNLEVTGTSGHMHALASRWRRDAG